MNALYVAWCPGRDGTTEPGIVKRDRSAWRPVGRLEYDDAKKLYKFFYVEGARMPPFCPFPKMENLSEVYYSAELLPLFSSRLFPPSRKNDYGNFLRWSGFDPLNPPDPIAILGVSEGIKQTDAVEVFPCPQPQYGAYRTQFFMHGVQRLPRESLERINRLNVSELLFVRPEDHNEYDKFAVGMWTQDNLKIGYLPRYFARDCRSLIDGCDQVNVTVKQVNDDAPPQSRLLCSLETCWPAGFVPCCAPDFQPIPASENVPAHG